MNIPLTKLDCFATFGRTKFQRHDKSQIAGICIASGLNLLLHFRLRKTYDKLSVLHYSQPMQVSAVLLLPTELRFGRGLFQFSMNRRS